MTAAKKTYAIALPDLIAAELIKPGAKLERTYRGTKVTATVEPDGAVTFDKRRFMSPSTAAAAARQSVSGAEKAPATNGWTFWSLRAGKALTPLADLRDELISRKAA